MRNAQRVRRYLREAKEKLTEIDELLQNLPDFQGEQRELWDEVRHNARTTMYLNQMIMETARDVVSALTPDNLLDQLNAD